MYVVVVNIVHVKYVQTNSFPRRDSDGRLDFVIFMIIISKTQQSSFLLSRIMVQKPYKPFEATASKGTFVF